MSKPVVHPPRPCLYCQTPFTPKNARGEYCGNACRQAADRARRAAGSGQRIDYQRSTRKVWRWDPQQRRSVYDEVPNGRTTIVLGPEGRALAALRVVTAKGSSTKETPAARKRREERERAAAYEAGTGRNAAGWLRAELEDAQRLYREDRRYPWPWGGRASWLDIVARDNLPLPAWAGGDATPAETARAGGRRYVDGAALLVPADPARQLYQHGRTGIYPDGDGWIIRRLPRPGARRG